MVRTARQPHSGGRQRLLRRLAGDGAGIAAVEFALILPVMLTLYFGAVEFGDVLTIDRKVTHVTSSLADLVTQSRTISDTDMANILDATAAIVTPYDDSLLRITVSGVSIDKDGKATVAWSDARNATPFAVNSVVTVPQALDIPNTFLVTAQVHYLYTPLIGYMVTGPWDLKDRFYLQPRLSNDVKGVSG